MDFFGENTGLYFYSAVFQGNMALLGILAIFLVFRLQNLYARLDQYREMIHLRVLTICNKHHCMVLTHNKYTLEGLREWIRLTAKADLAEAKAAGMELMSDLEINNWFSVAVYHESLISRIVPRYKIPLTWNLIVILMALILLPMAAYLHETLSTWQEAFFILAVILTNAISLTATVKFLLSAMTPSEEFMPLSLPYAQTDK